jgi:hypothetical protein
LYGIDEKGSTSNLLSFWHARASMNAQRKGYGTSRGLPSSVFLPRTTARLTPGLRGACAFCSLPLTRRILIRTIP